MSIGTRQLSTDAVSRALTVQLKLYRREGATVVKPVGHSPHSQFALLPGVEALQFGYYGRADGDDLARWHRTWASRRNLPQVVSIQVSVFSGPSDRRSQTLFIALPVARID